MPVCMCLCFGVCVCARGYKRQGKERDRKGGKGKGREGKGGKGKGREGKEREGKGRTTNHQNKQNNPTKQNETYKQTYQNTPLLVRVTLV